MTDPGEYVNGGPIEAGEGYIEAPIVSDPANEKLLLGALIIKPDAFFSVREEITASDFFDPLHARIFASLEEQSETGEPVSLKRIIADLGDDSTSVVIEGKTVPQYLAALAAGTSLSEDFRGIARYLAQLASHRREEPDSFNPIQDRPKSHFGAITWEELDIPGEELSYLIDDWLTIAGMSVIAGPSKSGKSFLAIDAAMRIALATVWQHLPQEAQDRLGEFFGHKIMKGGLVIYQAGEGSMGVKQRLRAFRKHFKIPADLHVPFVLLRKKIDLYRPAQPGKDSDATKLITEAKAWRTYYDLPHLLTVVDTLATATAGADENSARDMTTVFSNCERIRDETGSHVSIVHHMNAGGTKVRGHSSIYANMDQIVLVTKDEATGIRTALLDKQKDGQDGAQVRFQLQSVEIGERSDGKKITSCVCLDVGEKDRIRLRREKQAFSPNARERLFLEAFFEALKTDGVPIRDDVPAPSNVTHVAPIERIKEEFSDRVWPNAETDTKHDAKVRQAMSYVGSTLVKFNVIGRHKKWVWWTGRPIRSFPQTLKHEEETDPRPEAPLPDDVDEFLKGG